MWIGFVSVRHDFLAIKSVNVILQGLHDKITVGTLLLANGTELLTKDDLDSALLSLFDLHLSILDPSSFLGISSAESAESYEYCGVQKLFLEGTTETF